MAKILLLAQGKHIVTYAEQVRASIDTPDDLDIVLAHMDSAVSLARKHMRADTEVLMARSNTADILREAGIAIPVVKIPVSNDEVINSITEARKVAEPGTAIGFLGFQNTTDFLNSFLGLLSFPVRQYELFTTEQARRQIEQARADGVSVLISGDRYRQMVIEAGLKSVLLGSSVSSIAAAYQRAREIIDALALEKKKSQETRTIFNTVSDAIVSVDATCRITMVNRYACLIFDQQPADLADRDISLIFSLQEQNLIRQVLETGEENIGGILDRRGRKYAMRIVPIVVDRKCEGVVVTLQETRALQRMEATVRRGLYQRGNVAQYVFEDIKGRSRVIRETVETARSFSRLQSNILIIGETGTGKELFAQSIHNASPRRDCPFVAVNCGAIPAHLVESELFGYEDGAFTGAKKGGKMGLFELAHSGTIFLDEITEMDPGGQVNLLRALQERQIRRVGGNTVVPVDVRVIAACNANLADMVRDNRFRRDLYYRLSVLVLELPPLRQRQEDVAQLANYFIEEYGRQFGKSIMLSDAAHRELEAMNWDGNIRHLRNFCERIAAVAQEPVVGSAFIRKLFGIGPFPQGAVSISPSVAVTVQPPPVRKDEVVVIKGEIFTRDQMAEMLTLHQGDRQSLAKRLGISRTTLWKYLKKLDIAS